MNDAAYFTAAIPEPFRILGLKLKPFSLGHYILLKRFNNPFVADEPAGATRDALIFACLICSMAYQEFLEFIEAPDYIKQVQKWGKKVGIFDLPSKVELFQRYITEGSKEPQYFVTDKSDNKPTSAHWSQSLFIALTTQCGYSRQEALNSPLSQCFADWMSFAEAQGLVEMVTDEDIAMAKANEEIFKALEKQGGENGA